MADSNVHSLLKNSYLTICYQFCDKVILCPTTESAITKIICGARIILLQPKNPPPQKKKFRYETKIICEFCEIFCHTFLFSSTGGAKTKKESEVKLFQPPSPPKNFVTGPTA